MSEPLNPAIEEAYEKAGGRKKVQESLGVTKATLSDWKKWGYVPVQSRSKTCPNPCVALERLSGVSRARLNPNFDWGPLRKRAAVA
jgi:DNA-binding transcriptional regulator YdaS (Cro superfamily)